MKKPSKKTLKNKLDKEVSRPFIWCRSGKYLVRRFLKRGVCETCGKVFYSKKKGARFCCRGCILWRGGFTLRSNGYYWVKKRSHPKANSQGYVYLHRVVAEKKLGRLLEDWEVVHHKDRNKQNNNPENLEVLSEYDHARLHIGDRWIGRKFHHKDKEHCEKV